jgi:hypothetical protein
LPDVLRQNFETALTALGKANSRVGIEVKVIAAPENELCGKVMADMISLGGWVAKPTDSGDKVFRYEGNPGDGIQIRADPTPFLARDVLLQAFKQAQIPVAYNGTLERRGEIQVLVGNINGIMEVR